MKILVIGGSGFIGGNIVRALIKKEFDVSAGVRNPSAANVPAIVCDFTKETDEESWQSKVAGFDIVINAVGIIQENAHQSFDNLHTKAPIALFGACQKEGVKKIIQISALGADEQARSAYHLSKKRADDFLRSLDIDYCILKPSIVYGQGGKSTALFTALANLPIIPIIEDGSQQLQPVCIDDLCDTVYMAVISTQKKCELDIVGDKAINYKEMLFKFRRWLGNKETVAISIPESMSLFGKILDEPSVSRESISMLKRGNAADAAPLAQFLGRTPRSMDDIIFALPASDEIKLSAKLYFIRPLLRIIIAFVWIWSGIVSAFLYPTDQALGLLNDVGISGSYTIYVLYIASFLDISLGVLTFIGCRIIPLLWFQIAVILVYSIILTFLAPYHWLHPFGPVLKNLPLMVTLYIMIALEESK
jgi:uncharacterized protein YbjT (DUF2867 family)